MLLYSVNLSDCYDLAPNFWEDLSEKEKNKARLYKDDNLRHKCVISYGVLRCILANYIGKSSSNIEFIYNAYGKPEIKGHQELHFNMSHSHSYVVYALSTEHQIGVDIELQRHIEDIDSFFQLALTSKEHSIYESLNFNQRVSFFYDTWTKKEALVKASGWGLYYPINTIETTHSLKTQKIYLNYEPYEDPTGWYCKNINIIDSYSCSLASKNEIKKLFYSELKVQNLMI